MSLEVPFDTVHDSFDVSGYISHLVIIYCVSFLRGDYGGFIIWVMGCSATQRTGKDVPQKEDLTWQTSLTSAKSEESLSVSDDLSVKLHNGTIWEESTTIYSYDILCKQLETSSITSDSVSQRGVLKDPGRPEKHCTEEISEFSTRTTQSLPLRLDSSQIISIDARPWTEDLHDLQESSSECTIFLKDTVSLPANWNVPNANIETMNKLATCELYKANFHE